MDNCIMTKDKHCFTLDNGLLFYVQIQLLVMSKVGNFKTLNSNYFSYVGYDFISLKEELLIQLPCFHKAS